MAYLLSAYENFVTTIDAPHLSTITAKATFLQKVSNFTIRKYLVCK